VALEVELIPLEVFCNTVLSLQNAYFQNAKTLTDQDFVISAHVCKCMDLCNDIRHAHPIQET